MGEISDLVFQNVWDALTDTLCRYQKQAQLALQKLADKAINESKASIHLRANKGHSEEAGDAIPSLLSLAVLWTDDWTYPQLDSNHVLTQRLWIPNQISLDDLGKNHSVMSSRGVNYYDKIENLGQIQESDTAEHSVDEILKELASA